MRVVDVCVPKTRRYWVCYASFTVLEAFVDYILFWIPFYYALKIVFLMWLFLPTTRGAESVIIVFR